MQNKISLALMLFIISTVGISCKVNAIETIASLFQTVPISKLRIQSGGEAGLISYSTSKLLAQDRFLIGNAQSLSLTGGSNIALVALKNNPFLLAHASSVCSAIKECEQNKDPVESLEKLFNNDSIKAIVNDAVRQGITFDAQISSSDDERCVLLAAFLISEIEALHVPLRASYSSERKTLTLRPINY
jgi:hypothetical protein